MNPELYFNSFVPQDMLVRQPKTGDTFSGMATSQISLFKLTVSSGNSIEQPIRPDERFSGVLVVQLNRPTPATQIVLTFTGTERRLSGPKGSAKFTTTDIFTTELAVWEAMRKGISASTVLSDGIHVYNFSCQMPHLNYPQNIQAPECDISYVLDAKLLAPKEGGGEQMVVHVEKDVFFTPLVTTMPNTDSPAISETLFFEKKGKKGKPAAELRAAISNHQIVPGSKVKIDMSIKELASANWTKVVARLYERTRCRDPTMTPPAEPLWSVDRVLAQNELVRSSVYNFFLNDDVLSQAEPESKAANSEATCTETLILPVPLVACSPLNTDALEFTHFIRIEIVIPSWLSSDRHVYTDVPVQLLTCELHSAARILHRQASLTNLERKGTESDSSSVVSVKSNRSTMFRPLSDDSMERHGTVLSSEGKAAVLSALPPRYCDVHTVQRPSPTLILLKQANSGAPVDSNQESNNALQRLSRQSQSTTRHTTMSSLQSIECRSVASTSSTADELAEEKYRTRQLPPPPPLPLEPMPTSNLVPASAYSSKLQAPVRSSTHSHGSTISSLSQTQPQLRKGSNPSALSPFSPGDAPSNPDLATVQQGLAALSFSGPPIVVSNGGNQKMPPGSAGHVRTPVSPLYNENLTPGTYSDDDAGYFKSSANKKSIERGRTPERSLFRLRKNSSIKQSR